MMRRYLLIAAAPMIALLMMGAKGSCTPTASTVVSTGNGAAEVATPGSSAVASSIPSGAPAPDNGSSKPPHKRIRGRNGASDVCGTMPNTHVIYTWTVKSPYFTNIDLTCKGIRHIQATHSDGSSDSRTVISCLTTMINRGTESAPDIFRRSVTYKYGPVADWGAVVVSTITQNVITAWYPPGRGWAQC